MANFQVNLDLKKLKNAFTMDIKGQTGTKKCLCIPIEDAGIKEYKESLYLNLTATATQNNNYGQSHSIKQQIPKEVYKAMSKEEQNRIPFIGNMKEYNYSSGGSYNSGHSSTSAQSDDDLPY